MPDDLVSPVRAMWVRVLAAVAVLVLAVAVPLLFVLGAIAPHRYQPLIGTLLVVSIIVPIVVWFTMRSVRGESEGDPPDA